MKRYFKIYKEGFEVRTSLNYNSKPLLIIHSSNIYYDKDDINNIKLAFIIYYKDDKIPIGYRIPEDLFLIVGIEETASIEVSEDEYYEALSDIPDGVIEELYYHE
jgi:hypothetical protein